MIQNTQSYPDAQKPDGQYLVVGECSVCGQPAVGVQFQNDIRWVCLSPSSARRAADQLARLGVDN